MINEEVIKEHFIEYVTRAMTERDIRPWYVAYYSEICDGTFRDYMRGLKLPRPTALIRMADLFECSINELLGYGYFDSPNQRHFFDSGRETRMVAEYLSEQLDRFMKKSDMTPGEVASRAELTEPTIQRYLENPSLPDTSIILRLADALDCTPSDLLGY